MHIQFAFTHDAGAAAAENAAHRQLPVAGVRRTLERNHVTDLPAESGGKFLSDEASASILEKRQTIRFVHDDFRVRLEERAHLLRKRPERFLRIPVLDAKHVAVMHHLHARDHRYALSIRQGQ